MAQLAETNSALIGFLKASFAEEGITGVRIGSEWPSREALNDVGTKRTSVVALIHKSTNYSQPNMAYVQSSTDNPASIKSTLSDPFLGAGQAITLTIAYADGSTAVAPGDAVSFSVVYDGEVVSATHFAEVGETLNSIAAHLVDAINDEFETLSAAAVGAELTITNNDDRSFYGSSHVGSTGSVAKAVKTAFRSMQINIWTPDLARKRAYSEVVEQLISALDNREGFALTSGEWIKVKVTGSKPDDAQTDKDVYCDMYMLTLEHEVSLDFETYPVLEGLGALTTEVHVPCASSESGGECVSVSTAFANGLIQDKPSGCCCTGNGWSFQGEWNPETEYQINNVVAYVGSTYIAIRAGSNFQPDINELYWTILLQGPTQTSDGLTEMNTRVVSSDYTVNFETDSFIEADASGDPLTIWLPAPSTLNKNKAVLIKKIDNTNFVVSIKVVGNLAAIEDGETVVHLDGGVTGYGFVSTGNRYRLY